MPFQRHFMIQGPGWGHWFIALIFMILFWSVVIFAIWAVVRHFGSHSHESHYRPASPAPSDAALDVLKMRFAKGEIDEAEYRSRVALLREGKSA